MAKITDLLPHTSTPEQSKIKLAIAGVIMLGGAAIAATLGTDKGDITLPEPVTPTTVVPIAPGETVGDLAKPFADATKTNLWEVVDVVYKQSPDLQDGTAEAGDEIHLPVTPEDQQPKPDQ